MKIEELTRYITERLADTDYYLIDVREEPGDRFVVEIDSDEGVDIDFCTELARGVDAEFPREEEGEDYELEVGSAGLTSPFKVQRQYVKNLGQDVEVLTQDGRKLHGVLREADDTGFVVEYNVREKPEGAKRATLVARKERFAYGDVKMVRVDLKF